MKTGRLLHHDERSRGFAYRALPVKPVSVTHRIDAAALDQGNLSGCTGWAAAQWLNTRIAVNNRKRYNKFRPGNTNQYTTDADGRALYAEATVLDDFPWTWPPTDEGSSGLGVAKALKHSGAIERYEHTFSYEDFIAALQAQPVLIGTVWTECVTPETRVLTTDLEWLPVHKIDPGTELIGFDEDVKRSCSYRRSTVLTNDRIVKPCIEIETDRGTITVSTNHLFVQRHEKVARHWVCAVDLQPGDQILYFGDPWEQDRSWEAGWLAGFYDGEGCLSGNSSEVRNAYNLEVSQKEGPTLEFCLKLLRAKGYNYSSFPKIRGNINWEPCTKIYLRGPNAKCRFLGEIRPQRLLNVSHRAWEGVAVMRRSGSWGAPWAIVQSVKSVGKQEVMAIGTSTGTLITDGFLSHNSMFDPDRNGIIHPVGSLDIDQGHEYLGIGINWPRKLIRMRNNWTPQWGINGDAYIPMADMEKLLAAQGDCTVPVVLP